MERSIAKLASQNRPPFPALWRPTEIQRDLLPWLAEAMGAGEWDSSRPENQLRRTLSGLWPQYRQAGLRVAIRHAIEPLGFDLRLLPWHEVGAAPFSLTVQCWSDDQPLTSEIAARLIKRIQRSVSERDTVTVRLGRQLRSKTKVAVAMHVGKTVTSFPYVPKGNQSLLESRVGVGLHIIKTVTSYPERG